MRFLLDVQPLRIRVAAAAVVGLLAACATSSLHTAAPSPPAVPASEPVPAPSPSTAAEPGCLELLEQFSLGVDTPELRAKLENLHCLGSH